MTSSPEPSTVTGSKAPNCPNVSAKLFVELFEELFDAELCCCEEVLLALVELLVLAELLAVLDLLPDPHALRQIAIMTDSAATAHPAAAAEIRLLTVLPLCVRLPLIAFMAFNSLLM